MGLNSNVLDDLSENPIVDNEAVKSPSVIPQSTVPITIIPENDQLQGKAIELTKEFEQKLPTMDVTLKLVEGDQARLVDLEDIAETIAGEGVIGQESADMVNSAFEGLYDGPIKKSHFTETPSSINFKHVKEHMKKKIGLEEAALMSHFKVLVDRPIEDAKCILNELVENYLPFLYMQTRMLQGVAVDLPSKIALSNNMFVQVNKAMLNISKIDLSVTPTYDYNVNGTKEFDNLAKGLVELLSDTRMKSMILSIAQGNSLVDSQTHEAVLENSNKAVSIRDLIAFFSQSGVSEYVDQMTEHAKTMIIQMEKIQEDGRGIIDDVGGVRAYLTDNIKTITESSMYHQSVVRTIMNMIHLTYIAEQFFSYMSEQ